MLNDISNTNNIVGTQTAPTAAFEHEDAPRIIMRAFTLFVFLSAVLGLGYTALVTIVAQTVMPGTANGSILTKEGRPAGSALVVPPDAFRASGLFETRPSAASAGEHGPVSGGSNLAISNPALKELIQERVLYWQKKIGSDAPVPQALVTASSSGLDPHLPLSAALYQIPAVSRTSGISVEELETLVKSLSHQPFGQLGGEHLVNVPELNLALSALKAQNTPDVP